MRDASVQKLGEDNVIKSADLDYSAIRVMKGQLVQVEASLQAVREWKNVVTLSLETGVQAFEVRLDSAFPTEWKTIEPGACLQ
jgi:hypothetical protein